MLSNRGWGLNGYFKWISNLSDDYKKSRDHFLTVLKNATGVSEFIRVDVPPSGMFVWIEVLLRKHPRYHVAESPLSPTGRRTNTTDLMEELFQKLFDSKLVLIPASYFAVPTQCPTRGSDVDPLEDVS